MKNCSSKNKKKGFPKYPSREKILWGNLTQEKNGLKKRSLVTQPPKKGKVKFGDLFKENLGGNWME